MSLAMMSMPRLGRLTAEDILLCSLSLNQVHIQQLSLVHVIWNHLSGGDMAENRLSSISQSDSLEEMGEFWDSHDFTQFDTDAPDVEFTISTTISIEPDLLAAIEKQARLRGIGVETLVNLWLQEKLAEHVALITV
jgi:hypothetical protein